MNTKVGSTNVFKQDHLAHNQQNVKKRVCNGYYKMYKLYNNILNTTLYKFMTCINIYKKMHKE
jgi:hypothetical protein